MAQRYVRIQTHQGQVYYGQLCLNRDVKILDAPAWLGGQVTEMVVAPDDYRILPPCSPSKVVAVGRNYVDHVKELGNELPQEPLLFLKPPTTIIAHEQEIVYPLQSSQVDFEGELALIIGDRTHHCSEEEADAKIWGYTIANDVTARDLQKKDSQWTRAKGFDTFCPLGPWIVRELSAEAKLQTYLNDAREPRQSASVQNMVFSQAQLVAYISQIMTLLPGDVILTGTPAGVGAVKVGDRIRIEIEGIGQLENTVTTAKV
ncbi:MAG: fumarylacetoacetate hydrolase family protein [Limnothrix sp. RL_2_0]|nr:fumarylacetoacetate hydrolase family protein [Limnothrix sp. RL_2_0]